MIISKLKYVLCLIISLFACNISFAEHRYIAITVDDLPFVGESKNFHLNMIIDAFKNNEVPATGFIIAGNVRPENWKVLHRFRDTGLALGNHTFSHINLNKVNVDTYIQEIDEADKTLLPVLTEPKFFRYPYLATSDGKKKNKVLQFLTAKNYQVAPVTIDSKDFIFNQLLLSVPENKRREFMKVLEPCYLNFIWQQTIKAEERSRLAHKTKQPQILLIHANLLNAYALPNIINLYRQNGFVFVTLEEALKHFGERTQLAHKTFKNKHDERIESFMAWD
ncbi:MULTISPECIES: polysaccharide deacetylase family protein [Legionella]|uniref:Polysaccharide deacetylase n=1 Tax=Legionella septentrionalis TaxID=2498109 RepID=A0A433JIP1_9GAMM|nr:MULTISPECIES: polysaccharide deacetylase family protein [Legionella]MCP0913311.1 polysaccharide deacetylase family protein [Legionella sp. 27cVA30]RUQ85189.1 polysaccharide deacetylase [Legionella septentrionalis]RUQ97989.1 polysaccharide deacetylase [Legionella septentrionalis]RUR14669.1 polysaccharide deacetylase [Legionella septentrionalis]